MSRLEFRMARLRSSRVWTTRGDACAWANAVRAGDGVRAVEAFGLSSVAQAMRMCARWTVPTCSYHGLRAALMARVAAGSVEACLALIASCSPVGNYGALDARRCAESRDWRIYHALAQRLIAAPGAVRQSLRCWNRRCHTLDSTTIDLCLSLFDWAPFAPAGRHQVARCWTCAARSAFIYQRRQAARRGDRHPARGRRGLLRGSGLRGLRVCTRASAGAFFVTAPRRAWTRARVLGPSGPYPRRDRDQRVVTNGSTRQNYPTSATFIRSVHVRQTVFLTNNARCRR